MAGPTSWVNPAVVAPRRDGDIRLCIDVLQGLNGSKVFSELDLNMGCHQLELDLESREITTFAMHSGLTRSKRLLFGVNSASEVTKSHPRWQALRESLT